MEARFLPPLDIISSHQMKGGWGGGSTKAPDSSKRGSLVVSNPRRLISQIAVTLGEGDRARCAQRNGPGHRGRSVRKYVVGVVVCLFFADVYSTDPAVAPLPSEQILL